MKKPRKFNDKVFTKPSRTKQSFEEESNINNIVARYKKIGGDPDDLLTPTFAPMSPKAFADVSAATDYHTALNVVAEAQERFDSLPATVRERFKNDPGDFAAFMADEKNLPEAVKLGIVQDPDTAPLQRRDMNRLIDAVTPKAPVAPQKP